VFGESVVPSNAGVKLQGDEGKIPNECIAIPTGATNARTPRTWDLAPLSLTPRFYAARSSKTRGAV
jgi:hypothetical protein